MTTGNKQRLMNWETLLSFQTVSYNNLVVEINPSQQFQSIDGFGYTLTGGSAALINHLPPSQKAALLRELFSTDEKAISISYLRINIGASDRDSAVFSNDDLPPGQTDTILQNFSLEPDKKHLIPVLKEILAINQKIKILGSPWSPPAWMKDNNNMLHGGKLKKEAYQTWANYFVKFIRAYEKEGIPIWGLTVQNELLATQTWESCIFTAEDETVFLKNNLGPTLQKQGLDSKKIIVWDHNRDLLFQRASTLLSDKEAAKYA